MTTKKRATAMFEGFNFYETIRHLKTADLIIHTIPNEEWTLSCYEHRTLLVDVYVLTGKITGTKSPTMYECGRLSELLIKFLRYRRRTQYHSHTPDDGNIANLSGKAMPTKTVEEDTMRRLLGGDLVFRLIPNEYWRLTNTSFGQTFATGSYLPPDSHIFYLAEESTFGTANVRRFTSTKLDHILLEFLCQKSTFVEHQATSNVLEFKHV
jgi:hypothetical protein